MTDKNFSIGIVGGGAVGKAVLAYYGAAKVYDKYHPVDPIEEVGKCDYIFVAVPTPFKQGFDATEMDDAIANITQHLARPEAQVLIIKSTVLPGTTDNYQEKYPQVNFVFNPEFLTEKTAIEDFAKPDKQLVGFTDKTGPLAERVMGMLPEAPFKQTLPAKVCEMAKYAINSYYAFKVIFGNQIYDFCQKLGLDYNQVKEGLVRDARIVDSHFDVMHGGYRGFGGKCLPKDVQTLAWLGRKHNVDMGFVEAIIAINEKLRSQQQDSVIPVATGIQSASLSDIGEG